MCIEILNEINVWSRVLQSLNSRSCSQNNPPILFGNPMFIPFSQESATGSYTKQTKCPAVSYHPLSTRWVTLRKVIGPYPTRSCCPLCIQHIPHIFTIFRGRFHLRYLADSSHRGDQGPMQLRECPIFW